ncbi:TVP38/TMEM64 family protein, partial [Clostridium tarantellae]
IIPSIFLTGINIIVFGVIPGFVISLLGESFGAIITFILYRIGFKKYFEKLDNVMLKKISQSQGIKAGLLIFECRLIPFIPSGLITFAASISNVSLNVFFISSFFGKIPSIALETLLSYNLINFNENFIKIIMTLISILLVFLTLKRKNKIIN